MQKNFLITTDSTCDLPRTYLEENGIKAFPLSVTVKGRTYTGLGDDVIPEHEFYDLMRAGETPTTAQINPDTAAKLFEEQLASGMDILHIAFSSALSGSYNSAKIAADELKEKYPDRKIFVVDSQCASLGEGLLLHYVIKQRDEGKSIDDAAKWAEDNKNNFLHYFTVDDLVYLHRGGRVSKTAMILGGMLGIKPGMHVDEQGRLIPIAKVRGRKQSLNWLVDNMAKKIGNHKNDIVFISHGDCYEDAKYVEELVRQRFGINTFIINYVGAVIGAHSGPGTVALFFVGDGKQV